MTTDPAALRACRCQGHAHNALADRHPAPNGYCLQCPCTTPPPNAVVGCVPRVLRTLNDGAWQAPVHVVRESHAYAWYKVICDRCKQVGTGHPNEARAIAAAKGHAHCTCPNVGGSEFGDYMVDLCHERGIHDPDLITPLVNAGREEILSVAESLVSNAFGKPAKASNPAD